MKSKFKAIQYKSDSESRNAIEELLGLKNCHTFVWSAISLYMWYKHRPAESILKDWWVIKFANNHFKIISDHQFNREYKRS